jgi:hypothetical protein
MKDVGGKIKGGASRTASRISEGAKSIGRKIAGPTGSRRRRVGAKIKEGAKTLGGAAKRGASWVGSKIKSKLQSVRTPVTYDVDTDAIMARRTNDLMGDNRTGLMTIDELNAEQQRLDRSNRALTAQLALRRKWNDRRRDDHLARRRGWDREREYQRLEGEMFR